MIIVPNVTEGFLGFIYTYVGPALLILLTGLAGWIVKRLGTVHELANSTLAFQKGLVSVLTKDNQSLRIQMARAGLEPLLDPVETIPVQTVGKAAEIVQPQMERHTL